MASAGELIASIIHLSDRIRQKLEDEGRLEERDTGLVKSLTSIDDHVTVIHDYLDEYDEDLA